MTTLVSTRLRSFLAGRRASAQAAARASFGGDQEPVVVYTATNAMEADLVVALLASEDIPAFPVGASLSQAYGLQIGPLAEVRILVAHGLAPRARQIIEERHLGSDDDSLFSSVS